MFPGLAFRQETVELHRLVTSVTCLRAWQTDFGTPHNDGSGKCDSWTDRKNSTTATNATSTKRPAIVGAKIGVRTALQFDGVDDVLVETTLDPPAPATTNTFVWGVFTQRAWQASGTYCSGAAGQMSVFGHTSSPNMAAFNSTIGPDNSGAAVGVPTRIELRYSGSTSDYLKLGATSVTGTSLGNTNPAAGWNIGAATSASVNPGAVDVYACLVFSGVPNAAELLALSQAAAQMYNGVAV